jgi:hypothetical protein
MIALHLVGARVDSAHLPASPVGQKHLQAAAVLNDAIFSVLSRMRISREQAQRRSDWRDVEPNEPIGFSRSSMFYLICSKITVFRKR